ncbi:hypothetical protein T09_14307 [Trichinella sp. T9]|nr:hypothetical protein T09_14307 [Trichinella sp. T9]
MKNECFYDKYLTEFLACTRIIITVIQKCIPGTSAITITITVKRFLQYLGKYTFMKRATRLLSQIWLFLLYIAKLGKFDRFWKDLRQTNAYVSNKWLLKLPCSYLNTQGSGPFENPLKRIDDG